MKSLNWLVTCTIHYHIASRYLYSILFSQSIYYTSLTTIPKWRTKDVSPILQWLFCSAYCGSDVHPAKQHSWEWLQLYYHNTIVSSGKSIELMLSVSDLFPRYFMISPPLVLQTRSTIYILVAIPVFPGLFHQQLCVEFFFLPRPTCLCKRLQHDICVTCLCYSLCSSTSR